MLLCWHKAPHRIWEPALNDLDFDHDRQYPMPDTLFDDYSGRGKAEHDQDMMIATTMTLNADCKLVVPLSYTGLGSLLVMSRMVADKETEWAQWVIFFALGGFAGNFIFSPTPTRRTDFSPH